MEDCGTFAIGIFLIPFFMIFVFYGWITQTMGTEGIIAAIIIGIIAFCVWLSNHKNKNQNKTSDTNQDERIVDYR